VQKNRKILAHRTKTLIQQGLRGGADDDVVSVGIEPAEQFITDGAANDENLHGQPSGRVRNWPEQMKALYRRHQPSANRSDSPCYREDEQ
jgi:hypothetical protein